MPDGLTEEIDKAIEKKPNFWNSRADFVTYAVRKLLDQLKKEAVAE